jgi:hypothetical protein
MKRILLFAISLSFIFSSCTKSNYDSPAPANTILAAADGENLNFSTNASAHISPGFTGGSTLTITGKTGKATTNAAIIVNVTAYNKNTNITSGT